MVYQSTSQLDYNKKLNLFKKNPSIVSYIYQSLKDRTNLYRTDD